MNALHKIKEILMKLTGYLSVLLFAFMTVIGTYQIVTRYVFNRPSTVSEELLTYSFTWMALLISAYVFGKRDHMRMEFFAQRFTWKSKTGAGSYHRGSGTGFCSYRDGVWRC